MPASDFLDVFAVSIGNSIYTCSAILCDPYERCADFELTRIVGNVGRAGVTVLIPPSDPRMSKPEIEKWTVINHAQFDSTCADYFQETSLHLSFTGYERHVRNAVKHGRQDVECQYMEAVVSVYNGKAWVADLDILKGLDDKLLARWKPPRSCEHDKQRELQWTSLDTWDELIDVPSDFSIVRAHANSLARLTAAIVAVQKKVHRCIVLPRQGVCYECLRELLKEKAGKQIVLVC
ncbi:hypothetical protein M406DRAFT_267311 [Cryphonectria parasitica EP155]|uniref:Uncharacterized protein n=1 Tax=Cryphonectria parasitica (strain ATCC 38755 / EP155) TaxID=660469 RepID=A0A9P4XUC1_CRYP1|nr:uncharacterized protein M406DRAFT_267311 [Cryphonectria parasitica EP155]KAF3760932.1 hypothetical protein M406DRAFT_267311 [Cryphonectria parasitica EP155]